MKNKKELETKQQQIEEKKVILSECGMFELKKKNWLKHELMSLENDIPYLQGRIETDSSELKKRNDLLRVLFEKEKKYENEIDSLENKKKALEKIDDVENMPSDIDQIEQEVRGYDPKYRFYENGKTGPAGGYMFYDKGYYSDGWRFLEAAPTDITVGSTNVFVFGYYRTSDSGSNLFVNGTTIYNASNCTGTAIGTGKANTEKLVAAMGDSAYSEKTGSSKTSNYAAKLCADYSLNGYDDWFLPSRDEQELMYENLQKKGVGSFDDNNDYWSSSEDNNNTYNAWIQYFGNGNQHNYGRNHNYRVRAVRAF